MGSVVSSIGARAWPMIRQLRRMPCHRIPRHERPKILSQRDATRRRAEERPKKMGRCPVTSGLCWLSKICRAPNWKRQYQKIPKKRFWLGIVFCAKRKVNDGILWLFYLLNCIHYWSLFPSVWTKTYLMSSVHHLTIPFRDSSCVNCGSKLGHGHHELVLAMAKNGLILSDPDCLMFSPLWWVCYPAVGLGDELLRFKALSPPQKDPKRWFWRKTPALQSWILWRTSTGTFISL